MAHWSMYGDFDTNNELEPCCRNGHRRSFLLQTGSGGRICLSCLSSLISDSTAFLIHRTYAIDEFLMALKDNLFSSDLMTYHNNLLVTPLSEAIGSSNDSAFCKSVMDSILTICELAENYGKNLLEDFIFQIARQISAPSQWNRTQWHTLHLMGLLLDVYCKQSNHLPDAIRTQRGFFHNLVFLLQNPGAEFQGEVLFVLYKVASLEDGTEDLLHCCPKVWKEAVHALLNCESDEIRINCLALLTILAERSALKFEFSSDPEDERQLSFINGRTTPPLKRTFIQAVKGCLLSSDSQVQASALRLISLVYSEETRLQDDLQILVQEGVVNYVVEILRLSEEQETVQSLALDVLTLLSSQSPLYMHRFPFLLHTLIPILEKSIDLPSVKLQKYTLDLISEGVFEQPGVLLTAQSEQLLSILSRLFEQFKVMMDGSVWDDLTVGLPPTFFSACSTLIAVTEAPSCSLPSNASQVLQTATKYAAEFARSDANIKMNPGLSFLKTSVRLLQAAYNYNQRHDDGQQDELTLKTQENLINLCDEYVLPAFAENVEQVKDVDLVSTAFRTFTLILRTSHQEQAAQFALRLALQKCFTLSYSLLALLSNPSLKEDIYLFMSSLIERLVGASFEATTLKVFPYLPSSPAGLLVLLEQENKGEEQLWAAQHAVISILSISSLYNDRLVTEIDVMASLEQHLLLNKDSTLAETVASDETLKHFLYLYVRGKRLFEDCNICSSSEAEKVLEAVLFQSNGRSLLCSETPKDVVRWFLQKVSLRDFTMMQLLNWFTSVESMYFENQPQASLSGGSGEKGEYEHLSTLAELLVEETFGTNLLLSLFHKLVNDGNYDGIGVVLRSVTILARMAPSVGHQLLSYNFQQSLVTLIHPQAINASTKTRRFCLELLFQMLLDFHNNQEIPGETSWLDVANQCAYLFLVKANVEFGAEVLPYLNLVNMILFKSNEEAGLVEASNSLAGNRDLCTRLENDIIVASSQGEKLSKFNFSSTEGQILCGSIIFHLLRLRWALKHKYALSDHATSHFGFQTSAWSKTEDWSKGYATSVTCEELCRILYYGPTILKILASSCIAEIVSQLHTPNSSEYLDTVKTLDLPSTFFMSLTMALQGSVLEDLMVISRNASSSLFLLLNSLALSPQQRRTVANNPWNRMLVEHLLVSLSTTESEGATCTCGRSPCYTAHIALGILRINPPLEWLPIVFSPRIICGVVANLSEDKISPNIICIFHELLLLKYLTNDHLIRLRNLFQAVRKKLYEYGSTLHNSQTPETLRTSSVSYITECQNYIHTDDTLQSALLELVVQSSWKPALSLCLELDLVNISTNINCVACISIIDKFMQDSNLFSD